MRVMGKSNEMLQIVNFHAHPAR